MPKRKKKYIGGKEFGLKVCSTSKRDAQKHAEKIRKAGFLARVITDGNRYCVYEGMRRTRKVK